MAIAIQTSSLRSVLLQLLVQTHAVPLKRNLMFSWISWRKYLHLEYKLSTLNEPLPVMEKSMSSSAFPV